MARKNPAREALLAEVKARRRAAGNKVSRLERNGVRVKQAGLDPRLSNTALEGMNARQLRSHLNRLNNFTDRSNSYVAGHKGTPLSGTTWHEYKRLENIHNRNSQAFYDRIKNLTIPGLNQTIEERLGDLAQSPRRGKGDYNTYQRLDRSAVGITGEKSLQQLLTSMQKKVDPRYLEREARLQRRIVRKMLERTNNRDLDAAIRDMPDEDLVTLVGYTDFMKTLESSYAMAKSISSDTPRWQSAVYEDNEEKIREWAEWASRHFTDQDTTGTSDDDRSTRRNGNRDRYGRFVGKNDNPEPTFARDKQGRFRRR